MEMGCCLDPGENGTSLEEGGEAGPSPPESGKDRELKPSEEGDNMEKGEEEEPIRTGWRRIVCEQSEKSLDYACILYECDAGVLIMTNVFFLFFQKNKSHIAEPFALILCLHVS
jgi:hypothetical protein